MFEQFASEFTPTAREPQGVEEATAPAVLSKLFETYGGTSFNEGLYRIHNPASSKEASRAAAEAYPELRMPLTCFGFDWLGRQFALDLDRGTPEDPEVVLLEPGTGEALEVPVSFSAFHDDALIRYRDSCLFPDSFADWLAAGGGSPAFTECVGYKRPLFLGGEDDIPNLELTDIDVYWGIMGQLLNATRHLPDGSPVPHLKLSTQADS